MGYIPQTPFRRPVKTALSSPLQAAPHRGSPLPEVNKWHLLQDIVLGRAALGLKSQEIAVLEVLLSFIPGKTIGAQDKLVVFPANATICARLNGMPCSTMRRHLARLVSLNLIARRDSPNGKRYQRNYGGEVVAYGFDLSPLFHRLGEIRSHADSARRTQSEIAALREEIALQRRDLVALLNPAESCEALSELCRVLRRRLSCEDLKAISARLKQLIITHTPIQVTEETSSLSNSDAQSEQQYHNTIINLSESVAESIDNPATPISDLRNTEDDNPSLEMVLSTCGKLQEFTSAPIQTWSNLLRAIEIIYPMMGIGPSTWHSAKTHLGATNAAAIVAAILERFEKIRSPNAYLNSLVMRYSKGLLRFKAIFSALRSLSPSSQL